MLITVPKRRPKRLRIFLDGSLETIRGEQDVRVRDISEGGVLIETQDPPHLGETVSLLSLGHRLEGVVLWEKDSWCGIGFESPLGAAVLRDFSGSKMRVGAPRAYRHANLAEDEPQIEVTPRPIRLRMIRRTD